MTMASECAHCQTCCFEDVSHESAIFLIITTLAQSLRPKKISHLTEPEEHLYKTAPKKISHLTEGAWVGVGTCTKTNLYSHLTEPEEHLYKTAPAWEVAHYCTCQDQVTAMSHNASSQKLNQN